MNFIDAPTARRLPVRPVPITAVIIHTTGDTDLAGILKFYHDENGFQPHYMIDYEGTVRRFVTEEKEAYHAALRAAEIAAYQQGPEVWSHKKWVPAINGTLDAGGRYPGYDTWFSTWGGQGKTSPLDLVTGRNPNARSVGIELQQPTDEMLTPDIFLDAQYQALTELLVDVCTRNQVPVDRHHVLGHYDVSPMCRSNSHGGWDPGDKFNWQRLFAACAQQGVC